MHRAATFAFSRSVRQVLIRLLACLIPLHGLTAGVIATVGPAHTHQSSGSTLVLQDFRRAPVPTSTLPTHIATAFGHFHGSDTPLHHHHAHGDASVVFADGAALQGAGDGEDGSVSPGLAFFFALLSSPMTSLPDAPDASAAAHAPWAPLTHCPALPERPPRALA